MEQHLHALIEWINANPHWAGIVTFLISTSESVAVIGTIIPGSVMMTAIGSLIGAGILPFWSTMIYAILGAAAGDGISYWLGYYFKDNIDRIYPFTKHPDWLAKGRLYFVKHGGKSVFFGRFIGPIRAIVPLVAGSMSMRPNMFFLANITSAIGWAPAYMAPGILLGAAAQQLPSDIAGKFMLTILGALLGLMLLTWIIKLTIDHIMRFLNRLLDRLWIESPGSRTLKLLGKILKSSDPKASHGQLGHVLTAIFLLVIFVLLALSVKHQGIVTQLNEPIHYFFRSINSLNLSRAMVMISFLGDKMVLGPAVLLSSVHLFLVKQWRNGAFWLLNMLLAVFAIILVKHGIHEVRPTGILYQRAGYSFPSGHTTLTVAIYGFFCYLFAHRSTATVRWSSFVSICILVLLVGTSRLYLSAHWFNDVVGGAILGSFCLMISIILYSRTTNKRIHNTFFFGTTLASFLIIYGFFAQQHFQPTLQNHQPVWPMTQTTEATWWSSEGIFVPAYRKNRFGVPVQPMNVQWAGSIKSIRNLLTNSGWKIFTPSKKRSEGKSKVILSKQLFQSNPPILVMTKAYGNKMKLVLRLWKSNVTFINKTQTLYVGTVNDYRDETHALLFERPALDRADTSREFTRAIKGSIIKRILSKQNFHLVMIKNK